MRWDVLTLFPQFFQAYLGESILKRAIKKGLIQINVYNIRDFTSDKHRVVDDYIYGGGSGMLLKPEPFFNAIEFLKQDSVPAKVIYLTPQGTRFSQSLAEQFAKEHGRYILICGRYEGIDERVRTELVEQEISIGDYILTGGELAALVVIDTTARLIEGVLGQSSSKDEESFSLGLLEYPQYTRPREFRGCKVPDVLLSGDHKKIAQWRKEAALKKTAEKRPDLLK
ncbi:MAG TPA: tRNA (guanosine(37)-N1)-methyltransferase TrmD [Thermodesulfovibrionia bacterium]|nr:tRNA (guanosine(37)-N1)-methyltransferase TrmD [Thermodesulfovibrionia bacterium]